MPGVAVRRAKVLLWVGLGLLGCGVEPANDAPPAHEPEAPVVGSAELDAYARGTTVQVRSVRRALQAGDSVRWSAVDSAGAAAAGMPVERFRVVSAAVESALKQRTVIAERQERLDSLRVELMVLRVRAEGTP